MSNRERMEQSGIDDANAGQWNGQKCRCENNGDWCDYCHAYYWQTIENTSHEIEREAKEADER